MSRARRPVGRARARRVGRGVRAGSAHRFVRSAAWTALAAALALATGAAQAAAAEERLAQSDEAARHVAEEIARAKAAGVGRTTPLERGQRVFNATGGCTCHTNFPGEGDAAPALAGGRALETPFGVYYSTNITPDRETGIGGWSVEDFVRAMREGLSPAGEHYFPVFPYTAFTGLSDADLADLKAYLDSLPPIARANRAPDAPPPFSWRIAIAGWKRLNFTSDRVESDPARDAVWNRGRYLVEAAAHCGECHTPRTWTGGLDRTMGLAGSKDGPEGELAPNITPDEKTGIGEWSINDLVWYLETGLKPDGDDTQGLMSEVIRHGYANLPRADREAIAVYLKTVPAIENRVRGGD